jgi:oligoendopeptidase F
MEINMSTTGVQPTRAEVAEADTWALEKIYATNDAWEADFAAVTAELPTIKAFAGKLGSSAAVLLEALKVDASIDTKLGKLQVYAKMRLDQDTADHTYQGLVQRIGDLAAEAAAATSYMRPELLAISTETLAAFMTEQPELTAYRQQFAEMERRRSRMRSAEVESLLAKIGPVADLAGTAYERLADADLKLPKVLGPDGNLIQLTQENFGSFFLDSKDRGTRERGFRGMMEAFGAFSNTFGALYAGQIKQNQFFAEARGFKTCVEAALDSSNLPVSAYKALIDTVHANLPRLHRYLELRQRILKVDDLELWDLYVPLISEDEKKFSRQEAIDLVLKAVEPLGDEYVKVLHGGLTSDRWVDWVANQNKHSGAYSWGAFGTMPYILMNTSGGMCTLDQTFTLAHEGGHAMHSFFTRRTQPIQYAGYTTFLAEMASTCNESLLHRHLLATETDKHVRQTVLNHALEGFRGTLFRQALFAEFELAAHTAAEAGEAITSKLLGAIHRKLYRKYYGNVVQIDKAIGDEWMRIPHFYSSFYVWQYSTGISGGSAFAKAIRTEGEPARKRYIELLSSGRSDYSTNLLAKAGVDFSTPAPVQAALDEFDELLKLFEETFN